jgi:HK97 gp10 family phage protein
MADEGGIGVDVQMVGQRDLIAELRRLKENVAIRVTKRGTRLVAEYLERLVKANVPKGGTGKLRFNMFVRAQYKKKRGVVRTIFGVHTQGKADNPKNAFYWRFVEFGHKTRPKNVKKLGLRAARRAGGQQFVAARHFILPAWLGGQTRAQAIFYREIEKVIGAASRRINNLR